jgi:hypothetical protein
MRGLVFGLGVALLAGCAASAPPRVQAPPLAEDLTGWSAPALESPPPAPVSAVSVEPPTARSSREKVYAFVAGNVYTVQVPVGSPMDVMLQPGERVHNLVGGDRSPASEGQETAPRGKSRKACQERGRPHGHMSSSP